MHEPTLLSRPFGHAAEDMEFDFAQGDRPSLVTGLLAACAQPADAGHWWARTVGERTAALLALLRLGDGHARHDVLPVLMHCAAADCGERIEIALPQAQLDELSRQAQAAQPVTLRRPDGSALTLRRPTGDDLRAWQALPSASADSTRTAMLSQLCLAGEPTPEDALCAAEALAQADPLVAFSVWCACPACGDEHEHDIDLEGLALQSLARRQRALFEEVHRLASRYGWSEREILGLGPARRARYLELIEGWA